MATHSCCTSFLCRPVSSMPVADTSIMTTSKTWLFSSYISQAAELYLSTVKAIWLKLTRRNFTGLILQIALCAPGLHFQSVRRYNKHRVRLDSSLWPIVSSTGHKLELFIFKRRLITKMYALLSAEAWPSTTPPSCRGAMTNRHSTRGRGRCIPPGRNSFG
jgi:hypothetical protein